jgi:hypothetical protein
VWHRAIAINHGRLFNILGFSDLNGRLFSFGCRLVFPDRVSFPHMVSTSMQKTLADSGQSTAG